MFEMGQLATLVFGLLNVSLPASSNWSVILASIMESTRRREPPGIVRIPPLSWLGRDSNSYFFFFGEDLPHSCLERLSGPISFEMSGFIPSSLVGKIRDMVSVSHTCVIHWLVAHLEDLTLFRMARPSVRRPGLG